MNRNPSRVQPLWCAAALLLVTSAVHAQKDPAPAEAEPAPAAAPSDSTVPEPAPADEADTASAEPTAPPSETVDGAPPVPVEETIFTIQGKQVLTRGHFELSPQFAFSVADQFTAHTGLLLSGIYHLKENVAFELVGGGFGWFDSGTFRMGGRDSSMTQELLQKEKLSPERVKLYQFTWLAAADLQWSPFYGKVSLHDAILGQFNLYLSVGAGFFGLQLEEPVRNGTERSYVTLEPSFGSLPPMALTTTLGGGLRFYFNNWLGVRLEVRDYVTALAADKDVVGDTVSTFDVTNTLMTQLGVSFLF